MKFMPTQSSPLPPRHVRAIAALFLKSTVYKKPPRTPDDAPSSRIQHIMQATVEAFALYLPFPSKCRNSPNLWQMRRLYMLLLLPASHSRLHQWRCSLRLVRTSEMRWSGTVGGFGFVAHTHTHAMVVVGTGLLCTVCTIILRLDLSGRSIIQPSQPAERICPCLISSLPWFAEGYVLACERCSACLVFRFSVGEMI